MVDHVVGLNTNYRRTLSIQHLTFFVVRRICQNAKQSLVLYKTNALIKHCMACAYFKNLGLDNNNKIYKVHYSSGLKALYNKKYTIIQGKNI